MGDDDAAEEDAAVESGAESDDAAEATEEQGDEEGESDDSDDSKEFVCNLKFKRIGCYADKGKKDKPLVSFMESDEDLSFSAKRGKIRETSWTSSMENSQSSHANVLMMPSTVETQYLDSRTSLSAGRDPTTANTTKTGHQRIASRLIWQNVKRILRFAQGRSTQISCTTSTRQNTRRQKRKFKKS